MPSALSAVRRHGVPWRVGQALALALAVHRLLQVLLPCCFLRHGCFLHKQVLHLTQHWGVGPTRPDADVLLLMCSPARAGLEVLHSVCVHRVLASAADTLCVRGRDTALDRQPVQSQRRGAMPPSARPLSHGGQSHGC